MDLLVHYLSIATKSIFIENILLAYFLGMCSFLAISQNVEASKGIGKAVIFVNAITVPVNWVIKNYLLDPGALVWLHPSLEAVNLSFLKLLCFIIRSNLSIEIPVSFTSSSPFIIASDSPNTLNIVL